MKIPIGIQRNFIDSNGDMTGIIAKIRGISSIVVDTLFILLCSSLLSSFNLFIKKFKKGFVEQHI